MEVKSGYGLNLEDELKQLRAARALGRARPVRITTTLLAAHATPPEFDDAPDHYIDLVCKEIIPAAAHAGLADSVDAFCETVSYTHLDVYKRQLVAKAVSGIGIFAASAILTLIHFPAGAKPGQVPHEVIQNLALVYSPIILALYGLGLILMMGYGITRQRCV